jgi:hypothetical protein
MLRTFSHAVLGLQVQSVASNPVDGNLLLTAGNDYVARLLDVRNLTSGQGAPGKRGGVGVVCGRGWEVGVRGTRGHGVEAWMCAISPKVRSLVGEGAGVSNREEGCLWWGCERV